VVTNSQAHSKPVDDIAVLVGRRIRILRLSRSLSQERLAELAGMHRTYLGGIERGERNPGLRNLQAIAVALDLPIRDLFPDN
jgi:transcriptional regulator with XRE-family HTH domain